MSKRIVSFREKYGPWALVAGASRGLGAEFAAQLAAKGLNVFLIARNAEMLASLRAKLMSEYDVQARSMSLDLARPDAASTIAVATDDIEIGLFDLQRGTVCGRIVLRSATRRTPQGA